MRFKKTALCALPLVAVPAAAILPSALASAATTAPWAVRIHAGGPAFTDSAGHAWSADQYYVGGTAASFTSTASNTPDPTIYQTERYGMSAYKIPLPSAGIYRLTLHLDEAWATTVGKRVFSVTAEGQTIVSNLDLVKTIGTNTAYDVSVPVRSADATLDLGFSATADNAKVDGIEVEAMSPTSTPTATPTATATSSPSSSPTVSPTASPTSSPTQTSAPATNPWPLVGTKSLYVSPTGSDSNPGTSSAPFRQVSKAASVATAGTVVHVAPGTYGYVESTTSGTSSAPITFVSDTKWGAKISAPGSTNAWTNTGDWVVIQNFEIADSKYSGIMSTASNGKFLGNHIHHMVPPDCSRGGAGIELQNYSETNNDSIGNVVNDILSPTSGCGLIHGIYYQGPNGGRILDNLVYQTSGWGIHLWHNANHITIANNTVFQNQQGGMVIGGSLEGNDIAPGIDSGDVVTNNVVVNNGFWGIREMGRVGVNTYANNLLNGNASGGYSLNGGGTPTGTVNADPMFVNYQPVSGGDYHLRTGSPAIDKGTSQGAPSYDLDLAARPQGAAMDIGAYEGGH
jgi:parallel beta-helix repeat protein